jgi:uncharacterized protein YecT (DUF1311 family)
MAILGLLSGVLLLGSASSAADIWQQCIGNTATNVEWGGCSATYLKRLDDGLNAAWKKACASLDDEQSRASLLQEQRAWLKFRDASCQYYANGSFGREGQVLHFAACRGAIIEARITDLNGVCSTAHQDSNWCETH